MLRNKKPRLPKGNGAVLMRLYRRAVKPALPLFAAAGVVLHKTVSLTSPYIVNTICL